jgi:regulator of protease activity HflC (stomatin/prohibitin superfamily)
MTTELIITIAAVAGIVLLVIACNIRIVPQSKAWVMERIGVYSKTWHTGLHIKFPIIEKAAKKVDLREQILVCGEGFNHGQHHRHDKKNELAITKSVQNGDTVEATTTPTAAAIKATATPLTATTATSTVAKNHSENGALRTLYSENIHRSCVHSPYSQPVITKDNVSMEIDTVVFYQVTDPKLYAYGHSNPLKAIEHLVATSLRNIVGGLELDETLTSRELINGKMRVILDEATDPWGIKITRVELRNIIISDVELAEAMEKQMIAERTKRAQILLAEGESQSTILKAEAEKRAEILVAEGKAEHIRLVNEAAPSQEFLNIRALEAFEKAADGQSNTIIVPSEIQNLAGLAKSASEIFKA